MLAQYMSELGRGWTVSVGSIPHPKVDVKFFMLAYVEVYALRSSDESYLDPTISFKNIRSEETLCRRLDDYLWFASGDQAQQTEILMKYHSRAGSLSNSTARSNSKADGANAKTSPDGPVIRRDPIKYADYCDKFFKRTLVDRVGYAHLTAGLVSNEEWHAMYNAMVTRFPTFFAETTSIISTRHYSISAAPETNAAENTNNEVSAAPETNAAENTNNEINGVYR